MRRGDIVVVAAPGDYGKARPAVIVQTDAISETHESVVVCQMTSKVLAGVRVRVTVQAGAETGLQAISQIMADKPITLRRVRVGKVIGRLGPEDISRLDIALAFVMGLGG